jgi:hypothetical protein
MTNLAMKLVFLSGVGASLASQGDLTRQIQLASAPPSSPPIARPDAPVPAPVPQPPKAPAPAKRVLPPPAPESVVGPPVVAPQPIEPPAPFREAERLKEAAAREFAAEIVRLAAEANGVDRLWLGYKSECGVRVTRPYDFGREWFALWDRAAEPTVASPSCSDLLWRVLRAGEAVRNDILAARTAAQRAVLSPGTEVGMLRWHALEWR